MVSVISTFIKRNIVCLILSLTVILGGMWITTNIVPLSNVAYLLPTTYISSLKVITGEMMFTIGNADVNFMNGVIVLVVSNVVLFAAYYFFYDIFMKQKKVTVVSNSSSEKYHNSKAVNGIFGYIKFTSKRVLCRKSNIVMMLLTIGISVVFLVMNMGNQSILNKTIEEQIVANEESIKTDKKELSKYKKNSDEYLFYENQIKELQQNSKDYEEVLSNIENEDWEKVYDIYPKVLEKQNSILEQSGMDEALQYQQKQTAYFKHLQKHGQTYEDPEFPIYGLSFTTSFAKIILPIIITVCCIYLLAQFYTFDYVKGLNISILYPLQSKKAFITKIILGIVFSVAMYSVLLVSIFLIATLFTGDAGLQQPFMMQDSKGIWYAVSMIAVFKEWFCVGVLFSISLSIFMYILSFLIREDMFVLIIGLVVVLGLVYLPTFVDGLTQYAHILPTTYMNSVNVLDGTLAQQYANPNITVSNGVYVLAMSVIIQLIVSVFLNNLCITRLRKK